MSAKQNLDNLSDAELRQKAIDESPSQEWKDVLSESDITSVAFFLVYCLKQYEISRIELPVFNVDYI